MLYWVIRFLGWLAGRVPRRPRLLIGGFLSELVYWGWVSKRRVTDANMAQVLGLPPGHPRARRLARISWRNYGRYVTDFFYLPNTTSAALFARLQYAGPDQGWRALIDQAREGGRGLVLATAHFGNWDVAGVMVATHVHLHVIAETFPDPRMNALVQDQRNALGMSVIPMERIPRRILRVLQEGGVVATPVDRPLASGAGVPVTFFGRRCYVPAGTAQLALKTNSAIMVGFVWYDEAYSPAYYATISAPIFPEATGDKRGDAIRLTQRVYDEIEKVVAAHPDQWYMFRPFWPDPASEPPVPGPLAQPSAASAVPHAGEE